MKLSLRATFITVLVIGFCLTLLVQHMYFSASEELMRQSRTESLTHSWEGVAGAQRTSGLSRTRAPSGKTKVILLTYMRSGSSFTGDLLQQPPGVFYVYEPLHTTEYIYRMKHPTIRLLNTNTIETPRTREEMYNLHRDEVNSFFHCRLEDLAVETLTQYHMVRSKTTHFAHGCHNYTSDPLKTRSCLTTMFDNCQRSDVIALKVILFPMKQAKILMESDPDVKIIHLIRDPRGTLRSQSNVSRFKWDDLEREAKDFCRRLEDDLEIAKQILKEFPDRILTVRYEDITDSPVEATKEMYAFLHLDMSPTIEDYIWNITYAGNPDNCVICTTRSNATRTAMKWRQMLSFQSIVIIQNQCANLLKVMGYRIFGSEQDMRNEHISPTFDEYSPELRKVTTKNMRTRMRRSERDRGD